MELIKTYYKFEEVCEKLKIKQLDLLHLGANDKIQIVALVNNNVQVIYRTGDGWDFIYSTEVFINCANYIVREFELYNRRVVHLSYCSCIFDYNNEIKGYEKTDFRTFQNDNHTGTRKITGFGFEFREYDIETETFKEFVTIGINLDDLYVFGDELDRFIKAQTETPETQEPKEQSEPTGAHLAIIGAMLQMLITGKDNGVIKDDGTIEKANVFKMNNNQNSIADAIATFSTDYETHTGLSATKAKEIFAEANKYLKSKQK